MANASFIPIGLSILFPVFLAVGGLFNISPGLRFKGVSILLLLLWTALSLYLRNLGELSWAWQWASGVFFIMTTILLVFMIWSVLCWGYTLTMLLCLEDSKYFLCQEDWEKKYAGLEGINALTRNRATVLIRLHFAVIEGGCLVITKQGYRISNILHCIQILFGYAV